MPSFRTLGRCWSPLNFLIWKLGVVSRLIVLTSSLSPRTLALCPVTLWCLPAEQAWMLPVAAGHTDPCSDEGLDPS